jgi:hypothetical protein
MYLQLHFITPWAAVTEVPNELMLKSTLEVDMITMQGLGTTCTLPKQHEEGTLQAGSTCSELSFPSPTTSLLQISIPSHTQHVNHVVKQHTPRALPPCQPSPVSSHTTSMHQLATTMQVHASHCGNMCYRPTPASRCMLCLATAILETEHDATWSTLLLLMNTQILYLSP